MDQATCAEKIKKILESFYEYGDDNTPIEAATDLLTDLYHWCDQQQFKIDINQLHRMAVAHHAEEVAFFGMYEQGESK